MKRNPFANFLGKEDAIQVQVCTYIRMVYPGAVIHHSPLSGKRTLFEQYKLKALGASAGWPDLFIAFRQKSIAIELKQGKNKATELQQQWIDTLNNSGIPAKVCTGYDEAVQFIDEHFKQLKTAA